VSAASSTPFFACPCPNDSPTRWTST
jgi:hypothetical protein